MCPNNFNFDITRHDISIIYSNAKGFYLSFKNVLKMFDVAQSADLSMAENLFLAFSHSCSGILPIWSVIFLFRSGIVCGFVFVYNYRKSYRRRAKSGLCQKTTQSLGSQDFYFTSSSNQRHISTHSTVSLSVSFCFDVDKV